MLTHPRSTTRVPRGPFRDQLETFVVTIVMKVGLLPESPSKEAWRQAEASIMSAPDARGSDGTPTDRALLNLCHAALAALTANTPEEI